MAGPQAGDQPTPDGGALRRLHVAWVFAGNGLVFAGSGGSVHMQEVVRSLLRRGAHVEMLANRFGGAPLPGLEAVPTHRLERSRSRTRTERVLTDPDANRRLDERLAELGPFDLVYERFSLGSYAAMEHARAAGIPGILEINGPRIEKAAGRGALSDPAAATAAEAAAARAVQAASAVFAVSRGVADYVSDKFGAAERVQVVPNGVDPDRFPEALLESRQTRPRPFTVGFAGTFKPHHGLDTLVEGFALLRRTRPDASLLLVGEGRARGAVEERLRDLGLDGAARFTGEVSPAEVPALLAEMDVGVAPFPAERSYVSPLKVFEYMAAGLPVVASGVDQVTDLIAHGETGLLFEPGDAAALGASLERLAGDLALRSRIGQAGRQEVLSRHTWDAVGERILALAPHGVKAPR